MKIAFAACVALGSAFLSPAGASAGEEVWSASGLAAPESVLYDPDRDIFYVANVMGDDPSAKDGNGYLSILAPDGTMKVEKWVTGLDAPKGLFLDGDTLYLSDIDRLVAIDVAAGTVAGTWPGEGAMFLNDVTVADGQVFVSDMLADRIYALGEDGLSVWVEGPGLEHPNGLASVDGGLLVAGWGPGKVGDFATTAPGRLYTVDLATKEIAPFGAGTRFGNLDGLEPDGAGGWMVTDWVAGGLFHVTPEGEVREVMDLPQGSADLEYLAGDRLAVVPMMADGRIDAWRLD